jgi:hypothetical protein
MIQYNHQNQKEDIMKIETGYGIVYVEREGNKIKVIGNINTRIFPSLVAAKKFSSKNVELGGSDEVDDYILSLKK